MAKKRYRQKEPTIDVTFRLEDIDDLEKWLFQKYGPHMIHVFMLYANYRNVILNKFDYREYCAFRERQKMKIQGERKQGDLWQKR